MADKIRVSDLDFVYISYKEPNKEENWADLLSKVPWAKRVDGVKGFDSAHKAAAEKAETEFFISVDEKHLRYVMDVPKSMTLKRWLEIVQKITSPIEFLEYLENVIISNDYPVVISKFIIERYCYSKK